MKQRVSYRLQGRANTTEDAINLLYPLVCVNLHSERAFRIDSKED